MAVIEKPPESPGLMRVMGIFLSAFSVVMGLLVLFVIPGSCSILGSLLLVMLFFLCLAGLILLLIGYLQGRNRRSKIHLK